MPLFKRTLSELIFRRLVLKQYATNLLLDLQLDAKRETVEYVKAKMRGVAYFEKHRQLVEEAVKAADLPGLYLEFGVGRGKSIRWIAGHTDRVVHGFDSFDGIPEQWNGNRAGAFSQKKLPKTPDNVQFEIGMFDETLAPFLEQHSDPIAFLHVDCDLYSSTVTIFSNLGARLQPGAIILFDEYYNYPEWTEHEHKAFQEFVSVNDIEYEYIGYSVVGQQVAARILSNPLYGSS